MTGNVSQHEGRHANMSEIIYTTVGGLYLRDLNRKIGNRELLRG